MEASGQQEERKTAKERAQEHRNRKERGRVLARKLSLAVAPGTPCL